MAIELAQATIFIVYCDFLLYYMLSQQLGAPRILVEKII